MNVSVILAHPDENSFNHAIARRVVKRLVADGHRVAFHDLYVEKFNPVLHTEEIQADASLPSDIEAHCEELCRAEGIVVIHPNWWGQPPAILKGWVDRVIRPERAYRFLEGDAGEGIPMGLLKARCAVVFNTANTPAEREKNVFGDPLERIWKDCIFDLCGVPEFERRMFTVVVTSTGRQREKWLEEAEEIVGRRFV